MNQLLMLESVLYTQEIPDLDRQFLACEKIRFPDLTHLRIAKKGDGYTVAISNEIFEVMARKVDMKEPRIGCPATGKLYRDFHELLHKLTQHFVLKPGILEI